MIHIHQHDDIAELCRREKIDPQWWKRVRTAFYRHASTPDEAIRELPEEHRKAVVDNVAFHALTLDQRQDSAVDNATKLLLRTATGQPVESVILRIASGRTSLCVSSQVGCAAGCKICATGKMGKVEDLAAAEILDQVAQANRLLKPEDRRVRNVVFMGMGEPFHNEENVYGALAVLHAQQCFDVPPRRTMISTVGIPDAMIRCAERFPDVGIALSLHSARDEIRKRLIPFAKRYSLDDLKAAMQQVVSITGRPVMLEYVMLCDVNDSPEDAIALIGYAEGLLVHVNLIPYNAVDASAESDCSEFTATDRAGRERFAEQLRAAGLTVTLRYSLGADIAAACGQLASRQDRQTR